MEIERRSWKSSIRELYKEFQRIEDERAVLRAIDQSIIAGSGHADPIESLFKESLARLSMIHGLTRAGQFYIYSGNDLLPLKNGDEVESVGIPERLCKSAAVESFVSDPRRLPLLLSSESTDGLFADLPGINSLLLQPIYTHTNQMLGVVVFADQSAPEGSTLADPGFQESASTIVEQLSLAYQHRARADQEIRLSGLWDVFLSSDLGPTSCLAKLATMAPDFIPEFGPLRLDVEPEVQILVIERSPQTDEPLFLTIRATTGSEPAITKIDIADSISGLLVERSADDLPFFCDDPRTVNWSDRYKSYLATGSADPIKTEMAVRLVVPETGRMIGVLNLESRAENAFNIHHQAALLELADLIAPMVEVFEDRIQTNAVMHRSVTSVTSAYLDSLAGIFRHAIGTPLLTLRTDIDALKSLTGETLPTKVAEAVALGARDQPKPMSVVDPVIARVDKKLNRLVDIKEQIEAFTEDFASDISGFSELGPFDLTNLLEQTVSLAQRSMLEQSPAGIQIDVRCEEAATGFCSPLIKQHIYSLLTNAIYSLRDSPRAVGGHGLITAEIMRDRTPNELQEVDLNRRWRLTIRDNGGGVSKDQLEALRAFRAGTRFRQSPGHGLGLLAAQRYLASIGGWIEIDSKEGEYFEVIMLIDDYREDIHGPMSTRA